MNLLRTARFASSLTACLALALATAAPATAGESGYRSCDKVHEDLDLESVGMIDGLDVTSRVPCYQAAYTADLLVFGPEVYETDLAREHRFNVRAYGARWLARWRCVRTPWDDLGDGITTVGVRCTGSRGTMRFVIVGDGLTFPEGASGTIHKCGNLFYSDGETAWSYEPVDGAGIFDVTTSRVPCRSARKLVAKAPTDRLRWRYGAFTCRTADQAHEYIAVRCAATGRRVVRWEAGA